jgi:hypothetical protein
MSITDQIVQAESGGDATAQNPNSSASGPGQFIDKTWLATVRAHRPDLAGQSDDDLLALKTDPDLSRQMTAAYAADNQAILAKNGLPVTPGNTYLAHFAGPGGAVKVLQADPNTPVSQILDPAAISANPFLRGMTAQQLQAWAAHRMGAQQPQMVASAAPAPGAPLSLAPPPAVPQAAPAPQPAPVVTPAAAAQPTFLPPPQQMPAPPPLILPQRKQIDLSGLQAAIQAARAPIFANYRG